MACLFYFDWSGAKNWLWSDLVTNFLESGYATAVFRRMGRAEHFFLAFLRIQQLLRLLGSHLSRGHHGRFTLLLF